MKRVVPRESNSARPMPIVTRAAVAIDFQCWRGACDGDDRVEVEPLRRKPTPRIEKALRYRVFIGAAKTEVALRERQLRVCGKTADDAHFRRRHPQHIEMPAAADAIADDAGDIQRAIEVRIAGRHRGDTARHPRCVGHQQHRRAQPLRDFGRRALVAGWRGRVEQTHHPFDDREVETSRGARERREHRIASHHPSVEIVRGHTGRAPMISRVEVVRAAFESRDPEPARSQRGDEADSCCRLADAAAGRGDDYARDVERAAHCRGFYYAIRANRTMRKSAVNAQEDLIHEAVTVRIPPSRPY